MLYTIARKSIGYYGSDTLLAIFETEREADECLKIVFENGEDFSDERFGRIRYYVTEYHG